MQWGLERTIFILIITAALQYDFLPFIFNCWFASALMVGVTLGIFFDYLPHRPFNTRHRWRNSRVYPGRTMNCLIMGQNYHLIHHLWPSIPWFEYKPAYEATKHLLDAQGSPQRLGIFETRSDGLNFLYDIFLGLRSHNLHQSRMRLLAKMMPFRCWRRGWLQLLQQTAVTPARRSDRIHRDLLNNQQ